MLLLEDRNDGVAVYRIEDGRDVGINRYIATTPHTRAICNDPTVCGVDYTRRLQRACTSVLELYRRFASVPLECRETVVLNILRGGLNFGLREALADACGWNTMGTSFISAQRVRDAEDSEDWHITESDYRKVYLPERAQIVFGDVVATGTSLHHALKLIVRSAEETGAQITRFVFFTYGGVRAEEILSDIAALCRERFDSFTGGGSILSRGPLYGSYARNASDNKAHGNGSGAIRGADGSRVYGFAVWESALSARAVHYIRCRFSRLPPRGVCRRCGGVLAYGTQAGAAGAFVPVDPRRALPRDRRRAFRRGGSA